MWQIDKYTIYGSVDKDNYNQLWVKHELWYGPHWLLNSIYYYNIYGAQCLFFLFLVRCITFSMYLLYLLNNKRVIIMQSSKVTVQSLMGSNTHQSILLIMYIEAKLVSLYVVWGKSCLLIINDNKKFQLHVHLSISILPYRLLTNHASLNSLQHTRKPGI